MLFAVAAAVYGRLSGRYAPPPVPVPPAAKNTEAPPGAATSRRGTQAPDTTGLPAQTSGTSAAGTDAQPPVPQETTAAAPPATTPPPATVPPTTAPPGTVAPETAPPETEAPNKNTAPDFPVLDADGNIVRLSDMFGKPVVINFWATWCPPCRSELPAFDKLYRQYGNEVSFMMIDLTDGYRETVEGVKRFISENGYTFPVYYDTEGSAAEAYNVSSIPFTVAVGRNGNIVGTHLGAMSEAAFRSYINAILGG